MKTPFVCPVCNGNGLVPNGFYTVLIGGVSSNTSMTPETCRSCGGTGIVWSQDDDSDSGYKYDPATSILTLKETE